MNLHTYEYIYTYVNALVYPQVLPSFGITIIRSSPDTGAGKSQNHILPRSNLALPPLLCRPACGKS